MTSSIDNEIPSLVERINSDPDRLHSDYTPSVRRLIELGVPALSAVLDLILERRRETRMRAQRVIEEVSMHLYGFQPGAGWRSDRERESWVKMWKELGDLDWDASEESRRESVRRWRRWLDTYRDEVDSK